MKGLSFFTLVLFFCSMQLSAQVNVKEYWDKVDAELKIVNIVGNDADNNVYVVVENKKSGKHYLIKYSKEWKQLAQSVELKHIFTMPSASFRSSGLVIADRVILFDEPSGADKEAGYELNANVFNTKTLDLVKENEKVHISNKLKSKLRGHTKWQTFDGEEVFGLNIVASGSKSNDKTYFLLDKNLNKLVTIDIAGLGDFDFATATYNKTTGLVVLLRDKKASKEFDLRKQPTVLVYDPLSNKQVSKFKLNLSSLPHQYRMALTNDGQIRISGLISNGLKNESTTGFFHELHDIKGKQLNAKEVLFSEELLQNTSFSNKKGMGSQSLQVPGTTENGDLIILSETQYRKSGESSNVLYVFGDLQIICFKPDGAIRYMVRVPKRQKSLNDNAKHSGVHSAIYGNTLVLLYNDNLENIKLTETGKAQDTGKGSMVKVMLTVDENGKVEKKAIDKRALSWNILRYYSQSSSDPASFILMIHNRVYNLKVGTVIIE